MSIEIDALIEKGQRSLATAKKLCADGDYDFSVSRAYYAMFYLAEAALLSRGMAFSSHGAVIGAFGRVLVKAGHLPRELHRSLQHGFTERAVGDYDARLAYPRERAEALLDDATLFVTAVREYIRQGEGPGAGSHAQP
jgi:uncharacterized protein (UPF0332 family)